MTLGFLSSSCSSGPLARAAADFVKPEVRLVDLSMVDAGLFEQRFRATLRVVNPNDFVLPIDGLRFDLNVNEQPLARGLTRSGIRVPRLGEATIDVEASTSTLDLMQQFLNFSENSKVSYDLIGDVFVPLMYGSKVGFTRAGAVRFNGFGGGGPFLEAEPRTEQDAESADADDSTGSVTD